MFKKERVWCAHNQYLDSRYLCIDNEFRESSHDFNPLFQRILDQLSYVFSEEDMEDGYAWMETLEDGNIAFCGNPKRHGPGRSGTSMKLNENYEYQSVFDYIMYYGYPKRTTILGNALSKKDAHDVTQVAIWLALDSDYNGVGYRRMSDKLRGIVKDLAKKANAYDGKNEQINGTALVYFASSNKKQPMVVLNETKKPQKGKIGIAKVSTNPAYTDGNPYPELFTAKR